MEKKGRNRHSALLLEVLARERCRKKIVDSRGRLKHLWQEEEEGRRQYGDRNEEMEAVFCRQIQEGRQKYEEITCNIQALLKEGGVRSPVLFTADLDDTGDTYRPGASFHRFGSLSLLLDAVTSSSLSHNGRTVTKIKRLHNNGPWREDTEVYPSAEDYDLWRQGPGPLPVRKREHGGLYAHPITPIYGPVYEGD